MSWGTAQEGATLYALSRAVPKSTLLEAGLFRVDEEKLPSAWGFRKGDLPALGASPDGLLWHREGCTQADIVGAAQDFVAAEVGFSNVLLAKLRDWKHIQK